MEELELLIQSFCKQLEYELSHNTTDYYQVCFKEMFIDGRPYPQDTLILSITINGKDIFVQNIYTDRKISPEDFEQLRKQAYFKLTFEIFKYGVMSAKKAIDKRDVLVK